MLRLGSTSFEFCAGFSLYQCATADMFYNNDNDFLLCFGKFWHCFCQIQAHACCTRVGSQERMTWLDVWRNRVKSFLLLMIQLHLQLICVNKETNIPNWFCVRCENKWRPLKHAQLNAHLEESIFQKKNHLHISIFQKTTILFKGMWNLFSLDTRISRHTETYCTLIRKHTTLCYEGTMARGAIKQYTCLPLNVCATVT